MKYIRYTHQFASWNTVKRFVLRSVLINLRSSILFGFHYAPHYWNDQIFSE